MVRPGCESDKGNGKRAEVARKRRDMIAVPDRTEAAEYYFTYIDQVPEGDICALLDA